MSVDKWVELILGTVIVGGMGYLIVKVIDMTGTLSGVEAKVSSTSERVERIAHALPDVGIRIAKEEVERPKKTIVIVGTPKERRDGLYQVALNVIDTESSTKWTVPVELSSKNDKRTVGALVWTAMDLDQLGYASFSQMQSYAHTASLDSSLPAGIDAKLSFTLESTTAEEYLSEISWAAPSPQKAAITVKAAAWTDLIEALKASKAALVPK